MKHLFLLLSFFAIATTQAQTQDTLFVWKAGIVVNKQSIKPADMDSITFKRPVTTNPLGITTAAIPAGTFLMGSPTTEPNRNPNETQHTVTLSAFSMSTHEITCAQFAAFCNASNIEGDGLWVAGPYPTVPLLFVGIHGLTYSSGSWTPVTGKANAPMVYVNWFGAAAFAQYAGGRLPTEAEWEYAARATTTTAFNTGACLSNTQANYNWQNPQTGCTNTNTSYPNTTQNGGTYAPNAWGLYDMHGNVLEWCSDWWYGTYSTGAVSNPTGPTTGSDRVLRGGCWPSNAQYCRSAQREYSHPTFAANLAGFRIVF
jgi:formylglycine-generating enzyme required for sulfatase activity